MATAYPRTKFSFKLSSFSEEEEYEQNDDICTIRNQEKKTKVNSYYEFSDNYKVIMSRFLQTIKITEKDRNRIMMLMDEEVDKYKLNWQWSAPEVIRHEMHYAKGNLNIGVFNFMYLYYPNLCEGLNRFVTENIPFLNSCS